jgi:hypothetical protein
MISFKRFFTEVFKLPEIRQSNAVIYATNRAGYDPITIDANIINPVEVTGYQEVGTVHVADGKPIPGTNIYPSMIIKVKNSKIKTSLFHYGRYREVPDHEDSFARGFYSETVNRAAEILESLNPEFVITVSSKSDFNREVADQYRGNRRLKDASIANISEIRKKTLKQYASEIDSDPNIEVDELARRMMRNGLLDGDKGTESRKWDVARIYARLLRDIKEGNYFDISTPGKQRSFVTGSTEVSVELIARLLALYTEQAAEIGITDLHTFDNITVSKKYIVPKGFFNRPAQYLANASSVVVVEDNINTKATYVEVNKKIKQVNPEIDIKWVIGIINRE